MLPRSIQRPKCFARRLAATIVIVAAATMLYLAALQWTGNFHTVVAGEVYRSAQPSSRAIDAYAKAYGIRTILNLRGESNARWYRDEAAAAGRDGIRLINFPMSSSSVISLKETQALMAILRDAPKPLLIHCKAGADRTGLVSTLSAADCRRRRRNSRVAAVGHLRPCGTALPLLDLRHGRGLGSAGEILRPRQLEFYRSLASNSASSRASSAFSFAPTCASIEPE